MKWLTLACLLYCPTIAHAQNNSVSIYRAEMQPVINQFVFAGQVSACGLRSSKWVNQLEFLLIHMETNVAYNLWSDSSGKISKSGEKQLVGVLYASGRAFNEGELATGPDCLAIISSDKLTAADKAIGWEK